MGVALPALLTLWFLMPRALFWFGLRRGSGPTSTYFSALCSSGDDFVLYVGTLENFQIDANGQLDWVHLKDIRRRKLSEDRNVDQSFEEHAQTFYEVEATHFIIFGRTILTIAVTPFWLGETSNELTNT